MTMFEAWAIWSANQPERIVEGGVPKARTGPASPVRLAQLNERILHDIGMSKLGFPVARR